LVGLNITKSNETLLCTIDVVLISPRSEALVPVAVPTNFGPGLAMAEPAVNLHTKHSALAKAIVLPQQDRTVCKLLNPTNSSIFLKRHSTIAVINKLSIDSMNVIDNSDGAPLTDEGHGTETVTLDEQLKVIKQREIELYRNRLSDEQYAKLIALLYRNQDLYATGMTDLVETDVLYHSIDTGNADPVRKRAYRQSPEMMKKMKRQVGEMVDEGIVEESDSPWSSDQKIRRE